MKTQTEWKDIKNAWTAPNGYKWQCNGAMFVKNEDGKYVYNKNYKQRLVKISKEGVQG